MTGDRRGILYPHRLPEFHRLPPEPSLEHAVRWFWIPEWSLPPGAESRQQLLPHPICNLVVEPSGIAFVGPPTGRSERVLTDRGWAVAALLRPAAAPALAQGRGLASLRDRTVEVEAPELLGEIARLMDDPDLAAEERRQRAVDALARWIIPRVPAPNAEGGLANRLAEVLADPAITRVDQLAPLLHASTRTLQRVADHHFGLSLRSMIRRRRIQEAAERLREDPALQVSTIAVELGYADHAHFATDFKAVMGVTPSEFRSEATQR